MNVRPGLNFEISVQTISGLLSLGYQIGAIMHRCVCRGATMNAGSDFLHRTTETWYDQDGTTVTMEFIQELEKSYVQVKVSRAWC
jgi:hypothetical protein